MLANGDELKACRACKKARPGYESDQQKESKTMPSFPAFVVASGAGGVGGGRDAGAREWKCPGSDCGGKVECRPDVVAAKEALIS